MTNRDQLKEAILALIAANNGDGVDHGRIVDGVINAVIEGEIANGNNVDNYPPQSFIDLFMQAASGKTCEPITEDTDFYLPLLVYGLHKSNVLLGSLCYFYGEYVSVFLPNLEIGLLVDDEAKQMEINDTLIVVEDDDGEMIDEGCYSENEAK